MRRQVLDSALKLREQRTEDAKAEVGHAGLREAEAEAELRDRENAVRAHQRETTRIEEEEKRRLQQGLLRASDLQAQAAWRTVEAERSATLEQHAAAAKDERDLKARATAAARAELVGREIERKVIETHRSKQEQLAARAKDNAADDEMLEGWKPKP